ncbi:hypothetical protein EG329_006366 [Mollisiaceae sp. DMI_Dod_QoI]|nr:hypothetical protein EG329_006366 [Helotiales sp. DMI_Dod_QoI]
MQTKTMLLRLETLLPSPRTLLTAPQRPAKRRRVGARHNTPSESSKATLGQSAKSQWTTYRVSHIPATFDADSFHDALRDSLELEQHVKLTVHSFASKDPHQRISTITFSDTPSRLYSARAHEAHGKTTQWTVDIVHPSSTRTDTICIDTHFTGFTPVSPLANDEKHTIDCIAIHGWGSHPLGGFKAHDDTYMWLRDSLTKELPQLRVFIYGYACDLTTADSISGVDDYADTLRRLLRDMRGQYKTEQPVPLVFIAHSLGGMVLKQALIRMKDSSDSNDELNLMSVYGALFFGVPSQGMDTEALAAMVGDKPQQYDLSLLNNQVGHRLRSRQHDDFCKAFDFEDSKIIQFFETRKTSTIIEDQVTKKWTRAGPKKLLVNPASATFGRPWETSEDFKVSIDADHSNMVKFSRFDQDGYIKARDELRKFAEQAVFVIQQRLHHRCINNLSLAHHRRKDVLVLDEPAGPEDLACLRSLAFPEMNYRQQDTQRAHANTCGWITGHPSYTTWLEEGSGILWIKGKPGSGKSTVIEFLFRHFKTQPIYQESIPISFFLHGRGTILQKSRLGMYRSLLHQLLLNAPNAQAEFRHAFQERFKSQGEPGKDWSWHANELRAIFMSAIELIARTQPVNIFVDALDEANDGTEDQNTSHQIVSDFHELNDHLHYKKLRSTICFSCRHFPIVADNQGRDICVEEENSADISIYVCNELCRRLFISEAEKEYLADLQDTIITGAQGVFQWAKLVVALAIGYHNHGKSLREIRQMLAEVPQELGNVYKHILSEVIDKDNYHQTLRLMRWVYLAERPLTVTEVRYAMSLPDADIYGLEFTLAELELPTHNMMVRRIVSLSGGLIEPKQHEEGQILQFIHQSVNDFLLRDGLRFLNKTSPGDLIGQSHHQLSVICANYMRMAGVPYSNYFDAKSVKAQLPFIDYATTSWFLHAEKAETRGVPQHYILQYSQQCPKMLEHWVKFYTVLDYYHFSGRQPAQASTMLHIASTANLLSVVQGLLSKDSHLEQTDDFGNRALHNASRWGHVKVVKALLEAGAVAEAQNHNKCTALERAAANGHEEVVQLLLAKGVDVNKQTGETGNALYGAAAKGSRVIVQVLLNHGADINAQGGEYGNALQAAASRGHQAIVQLLLDKGADVNAQGGAYGNALQAAVYEGHQATVQLLLDKGADVNAQGGAYGNALQAAVYEGHQAIVQLLLDKGADVNAQGGEYGNALQAAAYEGHQATVQLLLDKGADVNAQGGQYGNALQAAAHEGHQATVQLLLDKGADVNAQGEEYGNALQAAAIRGHQAIVQLLLDKGADVNAQGGAYGNALQAAASEGHQATVQLLLDKGADVNAYGGEYGNTLQAAAYEGHQAIVQLLLDKRADVNAQGGEYGNALQAAAIGGHQATVQLLLGNDANFVRAHLVT